MSNYTELESFLHEKGYVPIVLTKLASSHLLLKATLNDIEGLFLLDTGASASVIEQMHQERFHMNAENTEERATGAGASNIHMQTSSNNQLYFENLQIENLDMILMSLEHVNQAFRSLGIEEVDGVIGADVLHNYKAIIDYPNLILYLKN